MDSLICRICLDKSGTISVFDREGDDIQYSAKLMRLVNNIISEDDGLPSMMCDSCTHDLSLAYQFVQKCEASDKALRCLSAPIELYSDLQTNIELNVKEEDVKNEIDDCVDQEDSLSNSFLLENCSKALFQQEKDSRQDVQISLERNVTIEFENLTDNQGSKCKISLQEENYQNEKDSKNNSGKFRRRKIKRGKLGPLQCVICGLMTNGPSAMEIHMRSHTGERPFVCTSCGAKYSSKGSLKRHIETSHSTRERKFTCETCGSSFFRKNDIISHLRVHTDERPYVCPFCSKRFRQIATRNRHQKIHTGEKPFSCHICNKKFAYRSLLKKHQSVHSDERKYSCHLCNKCFKSRTALNVHIGLHSNERQNVCNFCGMAFSVKGNLRTHIRRIHSEKSGQCTICLKTFSDLEVHMRKHTGEKPYVCGTCNATFAVKGSLTHHIIFKHENAGKFKCSIGECTKTFPTATMLEFHLLKQHTNHTPYICQHCPRRFFRNSDLTRHLRASHMDINFKPSLKTIVTKPIVYS